MNMKLAGVRNGLETYPRPPSDPTRFGHNFISKKIRMMRKKCLVRLRNVRIFYSSPRSKMFEDYIGLTF